jgi:DNA-binding transcriptional LysR family regulator
MLGESHAAVVASPGFIARHGEPAHPDALTRLATLAGSAPDGRHAWLLRGPDGATVEALLQPRLVTDDMAVLREAAIAGHGVTMLPLSICCGDVAAGRLVRVLADWPPLPGLIHCVFPSRRGLVPAVRRFIDFVAAEVPRDIQAADQALRAQARAQAGVSAAGDARAAAG